MPHVTCPRHGGHVAPLLCEHLAAAVRAGVPIRHVYCVEAWYLGEAAWWHHYCKVCAEANGVTDEMTIMRDDDSLDRLFAMQGAVSPVCPKCFDECRRMQSQ